MPQISPPARRVSKAFVVAAACLHPESMANSLVPNTRRLWKWILTLEGVAAVLPLLWLLVLRLTASAAPPGSPS